MKEAIYGPGELIYSKDDNDQRLFFLYNGKVDVIFTTQNISEKNLIKDNKEIVIDKIEVLL